mgnify:CR=1 FL=1
MSVNMLEIRIARWEMERRYGKPEWRHRAALSRSKGIRHLLTDLIAVGSHVLLSLGSALTTAGERLRDGRASGRVAAV